jgi:hypothetical protein
MTCGDEGLKDAVREKCNKDQDFINNILFGEI